MTEYWKSQARKYCEFCKCWFADNNVSISFHENGKRHKENVQKHISQLSKKSAKDFKKKEKMDDDIKKMEAAAMTAYLKDLEHNADLTSQSINAIVEQSSSDSKVTIVVNSTALSKQPPVWQQVNNDDGSSYYWNTQTNETTWDEPDEFLSVAEQEKNKLKEEKSTQKKEKLKKEQQQKEAIEEVRAHMAREKMKELCVKAPPEPGPPRPAGRFSPDYGPAPRGRKPYGTWTPVVHEVPKNLDLQLPTTAKEPQPPVVPEPEPAIQFTEKRVLTLGEGPVEFKKRKLNNNKRNMRQKLDDD